MYCWALLKKSVIQSYIVLTSFPSYFHTLTGIFMKCVLNVFFLNPAETLIEHWSKGTAWESWITWLKMRKDMTIINLNALLLFFLGYMILSKLTV